MANLFSSRKNVLTFIVVVMTTVLAVGIVISAIQGKLSWPSAFDYLFKSLFGSVLAIVVNIWGIATEDAAKKSNESSDKH